MRRNFSWQAEFIRSENPLWRPRKRLSIMKTISVCALTLGFLLPIAGYAGGEKPPAPGENPLPRPGPPHEGWEKADTDGDGRLSPEEFAALPRLREVDEEKLARLFGRLDKDGDGFLSREELETVFRPGRGEGRDAFRRLGELDRDGSGGVDFEEFSAGPWFRNLPEEKRREVFQRLDTDGDGEITPRDRPPPHRGGPGEKGEGPRRGGEMRRFLRELHEENGAVTFEEFRSRPHLSELTPAEQQERFDRLDFNGDGRIDSRDFSPVLSTGDRDRSGKDGPGPDGPES